MIGVPDGLCDPPVAIVTTLDHINYLAELVIGGVTARFELKRDFVRRAHDAPTVSNAHFAKWATTGYVEVTEYADLLVYRVMESPSRFQFMNQQLLVKNRYN